MAVVVITLVDTEEGQADINVVSDPPLDTSDTSVMLTSAQVVALNMLHAAVDLSKGEDEQSLIQLLN